MTSSGWTLSILCKLGRSSASSESLCSNLYVKTDTSLSTQTHMHITCVHLQSGVQVTTNTFVCMYKLVSIVYIVSLVRGLKAARERSRQSMSDAQTCIHERTRSCIASVHPIATDRHAYRPHVYVIHTKVICP
jgi:hypothetical protein